MIVHQLTRTLSPLCRRISRAVVSQEWGSSTLTSDRHTILSAVRWQSTAPSLGTQRFPEDRASREQANYQARVDLAVAYRAAYHYNLSEGVCNHLTLRAPSRETDRDVMLVVPYGLQWKQVTASSLIGVDFETGKKVEGDGEPLETAICIHRPVHNARYEKDGTIVVMHTHQPYVLAIACLNLPEPFDVRLSQNSMRFAGKIAYDWDFGGFAYAMDEGERLAKAIGDKDILLMGHHGVLTVGRRTCDAIDTLYYLERAAQVQVLVKSMGMETRAAPASVVKIISEHHCYPYNAENHFESLKKLFADEKPNFMD